MTKTYAVTGVASGIGAELTRKLKQAGHRLLGFDVQVSADHFDEYIPMDLNDSGSIAKAAKQTPWQLDGLCNNAGVPPWAGMEEMILQVNFIGTRAFTQAMLPQFNSGASIC
ncbi:MAG: SDR family NAD(P)-dependent oxidoreductase [Granulosicoccus sp.]